MFHLLFADYRGKMILYNYAKSEELQPYDRKILSQLIIDAEFNSLPFKKYGLM